jgi:hypothetical protein
LIGTLLVHRHSPRRRSLDRDVFAGHLAVSRYAQRVTRDDVEESVVDEPTHKVSDLVDRANAVLRKSLTHIVVDSCLAHVVHPLDEAAKDHASPDLVVRVSHRIVEMRTRWARAGKRRAAVDNALQMGALRWAP